MFGVALLGEGAVAGVARAPDRGLLRVGLPSAAPDRNFEWELAIEPGREVGELTAESDTLAEDGSYFVPYRIQGEAGDILEIELTSDEFDTYLILRDASGEIVARDDDSLGGTNSWLVVELPATRTYEIQVNAFEVGATGRYELRWQLGDAAARKLQRLRSENVGRLRSDTAVDVRAAIGQYEELLALAEQNENDRVLAEALLLLGVLHDDLSELEIALEYYQAALVKFRELGNRNREGTALNNIGLTYLTQGNLSEAQRYHEQALELYRELGNRNGEGIALSNLGWAYSTLGRHTDALQVYEQARQIFVELDNVAQQATGANNLGSVYLDLGESSEALRYYNLALAGHRTSGDRQGEATTLNNLGYAYAEEGDLVAARRYYEQALQILQEIGNRDSEATALSNIGGVYDAEARPVEALNYYTRALDLYREVGNRDGESIALNNVGGMYAEVGDWDAALSYYSEALELSRTVGNRTIEMLALRNVAFVYRWQDDIPQALANIEAAIAIVEQLRGRIASADLRTSYFATVQDYYQFQIELLMELHDREPEAGHDRRAFDVSERTRARTLIELLAEAELDVTESVDPALIRLEKDLRQKLQAIDAERVSQLQAVTESSEVAEIVADADRESEKVLRDLDSLAAELRQTSPAYADLQYPEPLTAEAVQTQVLDGDTTLLQYSLGDAQSYLWVVSRDGFESFTLPGRDAIETAARQFYASVDRAGNPLSAARKAQALSELILAPVADRLATDRLLVVPDGILHQVPFSALAVPGADAYAPLLTRHEVVSAPSSTVIATNRRIMGDRPPAPERLVAIADPIFTADDPRLTGIATTAIDADNRDVERALRDFDLRNIARLPNTQTEAERLIELASGGKTAVLDFAANYDWVMADNASRYQYVHFATHGFANSTNPELSGLILSLLDENGNPQNGFLRLTDIFNLNLPAELVVLSACQTGLGENVGGEGVVGLTRGLMYAGAERTVLSLWNVNDAKTAELMVQMYRNIWEGGLAPAAALRQAQLAMWEAGEHPYYWAAFGLQGEWRE